MTDETEESAADAEEEPDDAEPEESEEVAESTTSDEEDETEGIADGDVIRLAYTAYTVENGQLVDTTDQEVAEEEGVADQDQEIEPRVIAIGEGHLLGPVEADIKGKSEGDTGTVVVEAEDAFGEHDSNRVRTVGVEKISEDDRYPGAHVDVEGEHGFVETIIGGRARVDFNHPLAGEAIEYEYEILEVLDDRIDRAQGLLQTLLDVDLEVEIKTEDVPVEDDSDEVESVESLYIESVPALAMNQQWLFQKQQIAGQLIDKVDVDRVVIQEIIEKQADIIEETKAMMAEEGIEIPDEETEEDDEAEAAVEDLEE